MLVEVLEITEEAIEFWAEELCLDLFGVLEAEDFILILWIEFDKPESDFPDRDLYFSAGWYFSWSYSSWFSFSDEDV